MLEARIRASEGNVDMDQCAPKSRRQDDASAEKMEQDIASEFEDPVDEQDEPMEQLVHSLTPQGRCTSLTSKHASISADGVPVQQR
jgi:hypothetical protein